MNISNVYYQNNWLCATIDGLPMALNEEQYPTEYAEVQAYLLDHPEALQPEPTPPAPTPEQLAEREIAEKLAYLASTDWYVTRLNDPSSGEPIPDEILSLRTAARNRIDELRVVETL